MCYKAPFVFVGASSLRIIVLVILSCQVLAVEQKTSNSAGQQQHQWYERGWKTPSSANSDAVYIDDPPSRPKVREGSGAASVDDLDDTASGYGEDDEDSDVDDGSGSVTGSNVVEGGSGDVMLPPKHVAPSVDTREKAVWPEQTTAIYSSSTKSPTTSAHLMALTTTMKPWVPGPVATVTAADVHRKTTSTPVVETAFISPTPLTTSSMLFTMRPTTTTELSIRRRLTTTTKRPTTGSTTAKSGQRFTPPKMQPPILDDTNKATPQSFWMRPGVLAGLIGGAVAGLLAAILLVMFVIYRMRKKDEGSYALEEPKSPPAYAYAYQKAPTREFYA